MPCSAAIPRSSSSRTVPVRRTSPNCSAAERSLSSRTAVDCHVPSASAFRLARPSRFAPEGGQGSQGMGTNSSAATLAAIESDPSRNSHTGSGRMASASKRRRQTTPSPVDRFMSSTSRPSPYADAITLLCRSSAWEMSSHSGATPAESPSPASFTVRGTISAASAHRPSEPMARRSSAGSSPGLTATKA
ncbi:Uncharacterised protein [Collinsella intestinalis]|nr:Uncharacterised protein [Collinsella intestinalis]